MKIGYYLKRNAKNEITYWCYSFLGTMDLHSHLRLKPVFKYLRSLLEKTKNLNVLEIGCGGGSVPFQLLEEGYKFNYIGVDNNSESIIHARKVLENYENHNISFIQNDANSVSNLINMEDIDVILFIDVIEHILEPQKLLNSLVNSIEKKLIFVVSVPTPNYPKIFGKKFHKEVGHVVDGYTIKQLDVLFETIQSRKKNSNYNTGLLSNLGCLLYYRISTSSRSLFFIKSIILHWSQYFDFINNKKVSCSIFSVYEKY